MTDLLLHLFFTALGKSQAVVSKEELQEREKRRKGETTVIELRQYLQYSGSLNGLNLIKLFEKISTVFLSYS